MYQKRKREREILENYNFYIHNLLATFKIVIYIESFITTEFV